VLGAHVRATRPASDALICSCVVVFVALEYSLYGGLSVYRRSYPTSVSNLHCRPTAVVMTSYDRYLEYVRSPSFYYHHDCHQLHQHDEPTRAARLDVVDNAPSILACQRENTPTWTTQRHDGSRRRPALPAFTIDAILSNTATTTASGIAELTCGAEWSPADQQTTADGGAKLETSTQLTRGIYTGSHQLILSLPFICTKMNNISTCTGHEDALIHRRI